MTSVRQPNTAPAPFPTAKGVETVPERCSERSSQWVPSAVAALALSGMLGIAACGPGGPTATRVSASSAAVAPTDTPASPRPSTPTTPVVSTPAPTLQPSPPSPPGGLPPSPPGGLPTSAELAAARRDVARLPVRALAGQLIVARYSGTSPANAASLVRGLHLGGVAVFAENVPDSVASVVPTMRAMSGAVHQALKADGRNWPAIIAVDQEGGPVARLRSPATEFPPVMALGAARDTALAQRVGAASGQDLRALGFTVVMAPDADVTLGPQDPTIGVRSPGSDPRLVGDVASALVRGYLSAGVIPTPKHFPGHGTVTTDSHVSLPKQLASRETLDQRDLVPFRQLIAQRAPAIMVAHILTVSYDAKNPATLSRSVSLGLLRKRLGFQGLIVTDALEMGAISGSYGAGAAAVRAVQAGADVLLMPGDPATALAALEQAVRSGTLTRARLEESAARIVATMRHNDRPALGVGSVGNHNDVAQALAAASITQISGRCGARLVGPSVAVLGGTATDHSRFASAARRQGLQTGAGTSVRLLDGAAYNASSGSSSGTQSGSGDVVVALDVPYGLANSHARTAKLAAFGRTDATFDALVRVLLGKATARGHLPVAVGSIPAGAGCKT